MKSLYSSSGPCDTLKIVMKGQVAPPLKPVTRVLAMDNLTLVWKTKNEICLSETELRWKVSLEDIDELELRRAVDPARHKAYLRRSTKKAGQVATPLQLLPSEQLLDDNFLVLYELIHLGSRKSYFQFHFTENSLGHNEPWDTFSFSIETVPWQPFAYRRES